VSGITKSEQADRHNPLQTKAKQCNRLELACTSEARTQLT